MTVQELIDELKKMPPGYQVQFDAGHVYTSVDDVESEEALKRVILS